MANRYFNSVFEDKLGRQVMENSEVFMGFAKNLLLKDQMDKEDAIVTALEQKNAEQDMLESLQKKVYSNSILRQKLAQARNFIEENEGNTDVISKIDPNFIKGLALLDLGE
jgi:hypothetical protein